MADAEAQIEEALAGYNEPIRELAEALRGELKRETRPAFELAGYSAQSFNIGYGFTTTSWDCFCAIIVYKRHINLSFPSGAGLPDPEGLLHGTGVRVRHLKLKSLADVQTEAARSLLGAARERAVVCLEDRSVVGAEVTTVMKRGKK